MLARDVFGIELIAELLPLHIKQWQEVTIKLEQTQPVSDTELLDRAEALRKDAKVAAE